MDLHIALQSTCFGKRATSTFCLFAISWIRTGCPDKSSRAFLCDYRQPRPFSNGPLVQRFSCSAFNTNPFEPLG